MEDHLYDTDDERDTALHMAARKGKLSMMEYLVGSCRFDVTARGKVRQDKSLCMFAHTGLIKEL